jgi:hypothetical protein
MTHDGQFPLDITGLSPEEISAKYAAVFSEALESTGLVQVVEIKTMVQQFHILARLKNPKRERDLIYGPIEQMLRNGQDRAVLFFGKEYLLKDDNLVYGWVFSVGAEDFEDIIPVLCDTITYREKPKLDVMEMPMLGKPTPQSSDATRGRGWSPVGGS